MAHYGHGDNYGRGDYYRGDYYQGDFLGLGHAFKSIVSKVGGVVGGAVKGFLSGGPLGGVISAVGNLVSSGSHPNLPAPPGGALAVQRMSGISMLPTLQQSGIVNVGPAGTPQAGIVNVATGMGGLPTTKGYHPNKSVYETRGGGTSRWGPAGNLAVHPKGTVLVRNRRMNVGNARALKRALRRAHGFSRLARKVMSFTHPGHAGRGRFKTKRRK